MYNTGDIILTKIQFTDTFEIKKRPALILFEEYDNYIVAGITSNKKIAGITLSKKEGAIKESVIKLNYIFTISKIMIEKKLFQLSDDKKKKVYDKLLEKLIPLSNKESNISLEKLQKYFNITKEALEMAKDKFDDKRKEQAIDFFDMASRYYLDAEFFYKKDNLVNAFAALNYAHGWLDAGARISLFKVKDSRLFTVDDE